MSDEQFRSLADSIPQLVWMAEPDGHIFWYNKRWYEYTGTTFEEMEGWGWAKVHDPAVLPRVLERWRASLAAEEPFEMEFPLKSASGEFRTFLTRTMPLRDGRGRVVRWFGTNTDVEEARAAERERERLVSVLEAEHRRLSTLFEQSPAFVIIYRGPDHVIEAANPALMRLVGPRGDLVGKTFREAFPELDGAVFLPIIDEVYRTGVPYQGEEMSVVLRRTPGAPPEERFVNLLYHPLRDERGEVIGIFTHGFDLTEQVVARRSAEEASRLKDEFLATVSHELRTPLTAVIGWTHLMRAGELEASGMARALDTIERNARAQNQLIEDLLDTSRIITGKLRLDLRPVDLPAILEAASEGIRPAAAAKSVRLNVLVDPSAGQVSGDADRLRQVVWNLLSNAIKFTPRGGRVQLRLERVNSHIEIIVADTGAGIGPEFLPFVFDRFRQADGSTTRAHGGLGLGLAIVRHLVELHGGCVRADSPGEGQGATFTVALPLMPVVARGGAGGGRVHPRASGCGPVVAGPGAERLDNLRLLVVDDEDDTREMLAEVLARSGAEVVGARSAEEALAEIERAPFDLLISDVGMPGVDGYELLARVRNLPAGGARSLPAVALTAYARTEDRLRALRAGFSMHVPKPVEPAELIAVVARLAAKE